MTMTTRWYYKELGEQTPIYLSTGHPMKFEWLETSDAWIIMELDAAIQNQMGGIISITKEQYEEGIKKKNEGKSQANSPQYRQELQSLNMSNIPQRGLVAGRAVAVAGRVQSAPMPVSSAELPDPLQVPDPSQFKMPSVGKMP